MSFGCNKRGVLKGLCVFFLFPISYPSLAKNPDTFVIEKSIGFHGTGGAIWSALTEESELALWWNEGVRLEPKVGGAFYEPWGNGQLATGKVLEVVPNRRIRFTWQEKTWRPNQKTVCEFSIEIEKDQSVLKVSHSGWEVFSETRQAMMSGFSRGWDQILPKLHEYLIKKYPQKSESP